MINFTLRRIIKNNYYIKNKNIIKYGGNVAIFEYKNEIKIKYNNNKYQIEKFLKKEYLTKVKCMVFNLDFKNKLDLKNADIIIKNIKKIGKIAKKYSIKIGIELKNKNIIGEIVTGKSEYENDVISAIGVLFCKNKKERYEFLYDRICEYLDRKVIDKNICGFKNDKCIAKRNTNCTMGCCHHFKNKYFGILYEKNMQLCEYQKDKRCTAKCISCKMYMCDYLIKRGYRFTFSNVLLLKNYFNIFQKIVIKISVFTTKEEILKRLYWLGI